jgi:phosphocarrier protein
MTTCAVTIVNPLGLHARAAARFVHVASRFASAIRVARGGREMDGKSIMGLLLLSASQGSTITISADGNDEQDAMTALCDLVGRGFDEPFDSPRPPALAQDGLVNEAERKS